MPASKNSKVLVERCLVYLAEVGLKIVCFCVSKHPFIQGQEQLFLEPHNIIYANFLQVCFLHDFGVVKKGSDTFVRA